MVTLADVLATAILPTLLAVALFRRLMQLVDHLNGGRR